ncbi:MAG: PEGA domain-containing protein [Deltaproteobacteria bacterium]|nr:PEGA domain-containing protein [Deltaproteobacteria bacterium]
MMWKLITLAFLSVLSLSGCVERLITVTTEPPGAILWLNGEEVGATPVTIPFTWYGQYDVVIRKGGYETLKTVKDMPAPFYQWPVIDLISECLLPFTINDHHQWESELTTHAPAESQELIERAKSLRDETLAPSSKPRT